MYKYIKHNYAATTIIIKSFIYAAVVIIFFFNFAKSPGRLRFKANLSREIIKLYRMQSRPDELIKYRNYVQAIILTRLIKALSKFKGVRFSRNFVLILCQMRPTNLENLPLCYKAK